MARVRPRATFGSVIARAGLFRAQVAEAAGVSTRTIDALARPPAARREGGTREVTAWKIARGFAALTGQTEDAAFAALFETAEEDAPGQPAARLKAA